MADTIHKKKKDWPHFDAIHLGSKEYSDGWERIFGRKKAENEEEINESRRRRKVQKARSKTKRARRSKP